MSASAKPSLRFFHSAALRTRSNKVLTAIERDKDPARHVGALSSLVVDLTEAGLNYYFLKPLQQAKVGFVAQQTASFGLAGVLRMMSPIISRVLASTNATQLRLISGHIRQLMWCRTDEDAAPASAIRAPPSSPESASRSRLLHQKFRVPSQRNRTQASGSKRPWKKRRALGS